MEFKDAIEKAMEEAPKRNFTETIELILNFREIDFSDPNERIDKKISLPHGRGKKTKVGVIATGETAVKAREIADTVLTKDDLDELGEDKKTAKKIAEEHNHFLAEAKLMADVGKHLGQILGPRNKMPKPLTPQDDLEKEVERFRKVVNIKVKGDFMPTLQVPIGTKDMDAEEIKDNAKIIYDEIITDLPKRHENVDSIYVKTTMGPSIEVEK